MSLEGTFTALLLLLVSGGSAVIVPSPTNLKVRCQNLRVTVSWKYSELQPQTVFSMNISGSYGKEFRITDHQYDLSDFIWESEAHYMGSYYVTVTAIQGGTRSQPVTSETFAFNSVKTTSIQCELYFPPVALIKKDSGAVISFRNPFHFYRELNLAKKKDSASFHFSVVVSNEEFDSECNLYQENCTHDISSPEDVKCVVLNGLLFDSINVGQVKFIPQKKEICITQSTDVYMVTLVILLSVVVVVLVVVTIIICKAKARTNLLEEQDQEEQQEEKEEEHRPYFRDFDRLHFDRLHFGDVGNGDVGDGDVGDGDVGDGDVGDGDVGDGDMGEDYIPRTQFRI
ncbi:interferon gamma receptor 1 isoform X2 [Dicentrarchus labrax]|uniref:interferon gamma receptor 1 isoform X2 n=1 Tax=Dicentrarchus labrax TaxID=13489 RepID=UPI0021F5428D|nr:interferon gamma receptor 1 isoform X2 [Dicentrarchus labrax]